MYNIERQEKILEILREDDSKENATASITKESISSSLKCYENAEKWSIKELSAEYGIDFSPYFVVNINKQTFVFDAVGYSSRKNHCVEVKYLKNNKLNNHLFLYLIFIKLHRKNSKTNEKCQYNTVIGTFDYF